MTQLLVKDTSTKFEPAPSGQYLAICTEIIHLGTHKTEYKGEEKLRETVRLSFELHGKERIDQEFSAYMEDGRPHTVSQTYTMSLGKKANLRKFLEGWRGRPFTDDELKGFDLFSLVGIPAIIEIQHNDSERGVWANIISASRVPKGEDIPKQVNKSTVLSLHDFDNDVFENLSDWTKEKVMESEEYKRNIAPVLAKVGACDTEKRHKISDDAPFDDEVPF